jgi:hypothetical protein
MKLHKAGYQMRELALILCQLKILEPPFQFTVAIAATIMYLAFTLMHYKFKGSTRDTACGN